MSFYDHIVFVVYIIGMLAVAVVFYRKNKSFKDMFAAGGQSPWWVSGLSAYMTLFSAGTFVVWGGLAFKFGLVAISINMASGCAALLVGFFIAGKWKDLNIATPAEFIEIRFGRVALQYYTWMLMFVRVVGSAVALYALSTIVQPLLSTTGIGASDDVSVQSIIVVCGIVIVAYTIIGGLWAVLMTDVLQFIILTITVLFTVWLTVEHVDGLGGFANKVPVDFLNWTSAGYSGYFLVGWCAIHLFMLGSEWAFVQRFLSVPSKKDAKKSALLFGALYIISPAIWLLPAMVYRTIDPTADPGQAYILMSKTVLPLGMLGLVAAAMFSATASMVSSQINVFAGVLTDSFYLKYIRPEASNSESLWAGRLSAALLGSLIVLLALIIPKLGGAEKVVFSLMSLLISPLFAPALWGLFSKRIGVSAVWVTALSAGLVGYILKIALAEGGLLVDLELAQGLVQWSKDNSRMLDIYAGVVTPLIVLSSAELIGYLRNNTSQSWQHLHAENVNQSEQQPADGFLPLLIVTISILICAVITGILSIVNTQNRLELAVLTCILILIGAGLAVILKKTNVSTIEPAIVNNA